MNRANKAIGYLLISVGGISGTIIDPRIIFQTALKVNSSSCIIAHNHPSNNPTPSDSDLKLTKKLKEGGKLLDIQLVDHLIIMEEGYTSLADEGLLEFKHSKEFGNISKNETTGLTVKENPTKAGFIR